MTVALDANRNPLNIREGDPVGGYFVPASAQKSTTAWYRLMPNGDNGALVSGEERQFNITSIRSDILNVVNWNLIILNIGYLQQFKINSVSSAILTLDKRIEYAEALGDLSGIEYVMYPTLDFPIGLHYQPTGNSDDHLEIGFAAENIYNPTPKKFFELEPRKSAMIPSQQIQKLFYKFGSLTASETHNISWGEHLLRDA